MDQEGEKIKTEEKEKSGKRSGKHILTSVLKLCLLLAIVIGIPLYLFLTHRELFSTMQSVDDLMALLERYRTASVFIYIGLQILQVVISVLPGQVFQIAAGYMFTFLPALLFAMTGAVIGTMISFYLAKLLGRDFIHLFMKEDQVERYVQRFNSKRAYVIIFFIYLIPGLPKDVVSYAAGVSDVKGRAFVPISAIGRLPGMVGSLLIGSFLGVNRYTAVIIVAVIYIAAFAVCILKRKTINRWLDHFYDRISK